MTVYAYTPVLRLINILIAFLNASFPYFYLILTVYTPCIILDSLQISKEIKKVLKPLTCLLSMPSFIHLLLYYLIAQNLRLAISFYVFRHLLHNMFSNFVFKVAGRCSLKISLLLQLKSLFALSCEAKGFS